MTHGKVGSGSSPPPLKSESPENTKGDFDDHSVRESKPSKLYVNPNGREASYDVSVPSKKGITDRGARLLDST